jgi:hypothetical protein
VKTRPSSPIPLPPAKPTDPDRRSTAVRGIVVPFRPRVGVEADMPVSSTWDELKTLAGDGWCWRDPESLELIEACVRRLRFEVEREWGQGGAANRHRRRR